MSWNNSNPWVNFLLGVGALTTLAVNPWFAYDPINLPKMLILSTGAAILLGWLCFNTQLSSNAIKLFWVISISFLISLSISFFSNSAPWYQQLWGTWGRSTGLITYFSLILIMLASSNLASLDSLRISRISFERLGYFITFYTLIQLMDLDPINWSQKLMVATLGNLNFMSSFLGLTSISYLSRTLFEKSSVTAKLFFAFLLSLNLYLILVSESIQGVGVLLAGTTVLVTIYIRHKFSQIKSLTFLFVAMFFGSVSLLGTAGMGPFSAFRQDTVLFRIDYWSAAVRMIVANPLNGIGIDSYGDYYRQFRSLEAVARTGPQRVTNTAHNVFLDVFASAGLIAGALFLLIMVLTLLSLLRGLNSQINSPDFHALGAMWSGFIVFCLISINQIGVGIWGFIFTGLLNGFVSSVGSETTSKKLRTKGIDVSLGRRFKSKQTLSAALGARSSNRGFYQLAVSFSLAITIFVLTLAPNVADARFLAATRSQNLDLALEIITNHGIQDFHTEQLIVRLAQQGRVRESLNLALGLSQRNSQNWPAWVQVVSNQLSTRKQQFDAANNLLRLDPKNELLRRELSAVLSP